MVRRPAAVAHSFILVVLFQGIARAGAAEDAAAPPAVVPPPRHRKNALAAEAGLRGGVRDPELVAVVGGAHRLVFARLDCSAQLHWNWLCSTSAGPGRAAMVQPDLSNLCRVYGGCQPPRTSTNRVFSSSTYYGLLVSYMTLASAERAFSRACPLRHAPFGGVEQAREAIRSAGFLLRAFRRELRPSSARKRVRA